MELLNGIFFFCVLLVPMVWLLPRRFQIIALGIGTFSFLLVKAPISLLILSLTTITSYGIFQLKIRVEQASILIILQSTAFFVLFKSGIGTPLMTSADRLIPLGLSYYSFRQIHYGIECYKGKISRHHFWDYVSYMFFLPTILIGPINRFQPFLRSLYRRRWDNTLFSRGLERILYGYAKIVIIGNFLLSHKAHFYIEQISNEHLWLKTYLEAIRKTLNAYFQFAGYSDVAIGLALLMGFKVMENFNYPFSASNINEFWNRWHISLSSWCKDYVYTTIASISRRPILGIICTMLVIGLWHEFSLRYIVWGLFHGLGIAVWHIYKKTKFANSFFSKSSAYHLMAVTLTFHFVIFSFVIIREESWQEVLEVFRILFLLN